MLLKQQLSNYMNAGFPILYIDTFEEAKVRGYDSPGCRPAHRLQLEHGKRLWRVFHKNQ